MNMWKKTITLLSMNSLLHRGGDWDSGGSCNGETEPVLSGAILNNYSLKMKIVEEVIKDMQVPVVLLNVTRLTNFRKDGHPSIYGKNTTAGKKVSTRRQDCSHWCVPGVPDTWNELIYATLVIQQANSRSKIHWRPTYTISFVVIHLRYILPRNHHLNRTVYSTRLEKFCVDCS